MSNETNDDEILTELIPLSIEPSQPVVAPPTKNRTDWNRICKIIGICLFTAVCIFGAVRISQSINAKVEEVDVPVATQVVPERNYNEELGTTPVNPEPTANAKPLVATIPAFADRIWLLTNDSEHENGSRTTGGMPDEYLRQTFWMVARDEFGLRVNDEVLAEFPPDRFPNDRQFRIRGLQRINKQFGWTITQGAKTAEHILWKGNTLYDYFALNAWTRICFEEAASGDVLFKKCLIAAGFQPKPTLTSDAPVPDAILKRLNSVRETDAFAAVRLLHDEVRKKGRSPALIEALSRGYANLGLLTDFHWGTSPCTYKARSMLYAHQLVKSNPKSARAYWVRAYAAALTGKHNIALNDLETATKLAKDENNPTPPAWVKMIDAYVHFDLDRFDELRRESDTPYVRLLQYLAIYQPESRLATIKAAAAYLKIDPECYRVHDSVCRLGGVSNLHSATQSGAKVFEEHFRDRVEEQPGLPDDCRVVLEDPEVSSAKVFASLRKAGTPMQDRGEPSWAVLGNLMQDVQYAQAWQRLDFLTRVLGVDAPNEAKSEVRRLQGHYLLPLVENFAFNSNRQPDEVIKKLRAVPIHTLTNRSNAYGWRLETVDTELAKEFDNISGRSFCESYESQAINLQYNEYANRKAFVLNIESESRLSPLAIELVIARDKPEVAENVVMYEKTYLRHALVQRSLGEYYFRKKQTADAVRCLERSLALSPEGLTYELLADGYMQQQKPEMWLKTLEKSLESEDAGLDHARTRIKIAEAFMRTKAYKRAEPYADAAAESGASWAMRCAAECKIGLGKYDEAEEIFRNMADRYETGRFEWFFYSHSLGKMNPKAADLLVREYISTLGVNTPPQTAFLVGRYYLINGEMTKAMRMFDIAKDDPFVDFHGLFAALAHDNMNEADARDAITGKVVVGWNRADTVRVTNFMHNIMVNKFLLKETIWKRDLAALSEDDQTDAEFFLGWLFWNRKDMVRAKEFWQRVEKSQAGTSYLRLHASAFLKQIK